MHRLSFAIAVLMCCIEAFGQVVTVYKNGAILGTYASGELIVIEITDAPLTSLRIVGSTPDTDIGRVWMTGVTTGRIDLLIGTVAVSPTLQFPTFLDQILEPAGRHWGGLTIIDHSDTIPPRTRVAFAISGDVRSDDGHPGLIKTGQLYRGQVGGNLLANVRANPEGFAFPEGSTIARLFVNGTAPYPYLISADQGDIDRMVVGMPGATGVSLGAGVHADAIYDLVVNGRIETGGSIISRSGPIRSIIADGIAGGVVVGEVGTTTPQDGYLGRMICNGDFDGALYARALDGQGEFCEGILISGNLNGHIQIVGNDTGGGYIAEPITAGGSPANPFLYPSILTNEILPRAFDHPCGGGTTLTLIGGSTVVAVTSLAGSFNGTSQEPPVVIRAIAGDLSVTDFFGDAAQIAGNVTIEAVGGNLGVVSAEELLPGAVIRATQGQIGEVRGKVGTLTGDPVTITARDGITLIDASLLNATITVCDGTSPSGLLGTLRATTLLGSINTGTLGTRSTTGDLFGTLTLRGGLPTNSRILIGGSFGVGHGQVGLIDVMGSSASLHGQVVINAANTGGTWEASGGLAASVRVRRTAGDIVLSPLSAQPDTGPNYQRLPSELGGGSIAHTRFQLHGTACNPPAESNPANYPRILISAFCGKETDPPSDPQPVTLDLYGGVYAALLAPSPVKARLIGHESTAREFWMDIGITRDPGSPYSRKVVISGQEHMHFLPGVYKVTPVMPADETANLTAMLCDGLLPVAGEVPVAPFEYYFELVGDCNLNARDDSIDIELDRLEFPPYGTLDRFPTDGLIDDCYSGVCDGDVNCDFALDGFDVEVQEQAVGGDMTDYCHPNPDFNRDFALDGFDVEAVEIVTGGGPCP